MKKIFTNYAQLLILGFSCVALLSYEIRENGQVVKSGEFEIVADATVVESTCLNIAAGTFIQRIDLKNASYPQKIFLELSGNKLTLLSGCFALDGGSRREYKTQ